MKPKFLILTAFVLIAGCKGGPAVHVKSMPPIPEGNGWLVYEDKDAGLSIGVAPGWKKGPGIAASQMSIATSGMGTDTTSQDPNNPATQLEAQMEGEAKLEEEKKIEENRKKGIFLTCTDGSKTVFGEQQVRYFIARKDHGSNYNLDDATQDEKDTGPGSGAAEKIKLPIGPASKLQWDITTRGGDKVNRISYVIVDGKYSYHLRFFSENNPTVIQNVADQVAQTLRIKPTKDE